MKKLIFIGGPMGVGKTSVSIELQKKLNACVFLDGDWCWYTNPWILNEETRKIVIDNATHMLNNYIHSKSYENIIFCWVLHENSIIDSLVSQLDMLDVSFYNFSLVASKEVLTTRLKKDIEKGIRKPLVITRSLERLSHYKTVDSIKIDTSNLSVEQVTNQVLVEIK